MEDKNIDKFELLKRYIKGLIVGSEFENHVYLVGGCVRDELMGLPTKDIDICVDLPNGGICFAEWITKRVGQYKEGSNPCVFPTYGTAMFSFMQFKGIQIECVQTRKEQYHDRGSRNPETAFGTIKEDCLRRDLTINSLYKNISTGEYIDITGNGLDDIKNHIIRTPCNPNVTYDDDALRMLRCIRFATRYGWNIDVDTWNGIKNNVKRIEIITQERITDELNKILMTQKPSVGLIYLLESGLLSYVLPELSKTVGMEQNKYHFGTVWEHTLSVVDNTQLKLENRVAALFHDIGKIETMTKDEKGNIHFYKHELASERLADKILRRMKYPSDFIKRVKKAIVNHMRTKNYGNNCEKMKDKSLRKLQYDLGDCFDLTLDLIHADNISHAEGYCLPNQIDIIKKKTDEMILNGTSCFVKKLPVNGFDIMKYKNIPNGEMVGKYLSIALKLWLANPKITKEQCLKRI